MGVARSEKIVGLVVVVVTFFNYNFVNCKATLLLEINYLRNKIQYEPTVEVEWS